MRLSMADGSPFCLKIGKIIIVPQGIVQSGGQGYMLSLQQGCDGCHLRLASVICSRYEHACRNRGQGVGEHAAADIGEPAGI